MDIEKLLEQMPRVENPHGQVDKPHGHALGYCTVCAFEEATQAQRELLAKAGWHPRTPDCDLARKLQDPEYKRLYAKAAAKADRELEKAGLLVRLPSEEELLNKLFEVTGVDYERRLDFDTKELLRWLRERG